MRWQTFLDDLLGGLALCIMLLALALGGCAARAPVAPPVAPVVHAPPGARLNPVAPKLSITRGGEPTMPVSPPKTATLSPGPNQPGPEDDVFTMGDIGTPNRPNKIVASWVCPPIDGAQFTLCSVCIWVGQPELGIGPESFGVCQNGLAHDAYVSFPDAPAHYWHCCNSGPYPPQYGALCQSGGNQSTHVQGGYGPCNGGSYAP